MMAYNLYLDDWRTPMETLLSKKPLHLKKIISENEWEIVRTYHEFVDKITHKGLPEIISFDHDLGDNYYFLEEDGPKRLIVMSKDVYFDYAKYEELDERTGYHCAKWLVDYCIDNKKPLPKYVIHSDNQVGSENIRSYLENFKKHYHDK